MVRRASLAHHWNRTPNYPEQASESERVEGSPLFERQNSMIVKSWMNDGSSIADRITE
ncbi:MAG: hypothetical protein KAS66_04740 [Candidatus Omnitrophica bacterium]|nr:hypothetical protein [Candidatus Omnitrophota bacterium]